jgi:hypothetical protein
LILNDNDEGDGDDGVEIWRRHWHHLTREYAGSAIRQRSGRPLKLGHAKSESPVTSNRNQRSRSTGIRISVTDARFVLSSARCTAGFTEWSLPTRC